MIIGNVKYYKKEESIEIANEVQSWEMCNLYRSKD